jgi:protein-disulfide isomerase-like protein with CxxC motif
MTSNLYRLAAIPSIALVLCTAGLGVGWAAPAQPTQGPAVAQDQARTQREVGQLLDFVARSDCQFNRNGTWYDSKAARDHLKDKYDYLQRRKLAPDAEAFIQRAATESSMSGKAYQVRCGAQTMSSSQWLSTELKRLRAAEPAAPRK